MLVGGVVQHQIHNDADVALARLSNEAIEIGQGAVLRIDGPVVGDVVAKVDLRRGIDRCEPDGVDSERLQIVQPRSDAVQIADAVAVRILEAARINFVDDAVLQPVRVFMSGRWGACVLLGAGGGC